MKQLISFSIIVFFALTTISIAQSPFNKAIKFNGIDQYLEIPNSEQINKTEETDLIVEIKFKADSVKPGIVYAKFDLGIDANEMEYFGVGDIFSVFKSYDQDNAQLNHFYPTFLYGDKADYEISYRWRSKKYNSGGQSSNSSPVFANEWNYFVTCRSESVICYKFLNDASSYGGWTGTNSSYESESPLYIGGYPAADTIETDKIFYSGLVDELRIWNVFKFRNEMVNLSADTLSSEYYSTLDSGLVAYYRFDEIEELGLKDGKILHS